MEEKEITKEKQFENVVLLIRQTQAKAFYAVNTLLIDLYWQIGEMLSKQIATACWGDSVVNELANYIQKTNPQLRGFSNKNLWRMKQFYDTYKDNEKLSPLLRELSWSHNLLILSRTKTMEEKEFYLHKCISERYSKRELDRQISSGLYEQAMLNDIQLSPALREMRPLISEYFKDNYVLEFLGLPQNHTENDLHKGLVSQMKNFLLELGKDFIFIGDEYRLQVGNTDFFIDLLFYHRALQCLVAIELKADKFRPEHLGQLNFYLEALDRNVRKNNENPSIGILLCKDKDNEVVEYALSRSLSPTMVAEYKTKLPDKKLLQQMLQEVFDNSKD
jgi:predicted nuclease of restriction endonuclease-like (RecB) superfamily